jgi:threonine/homoserine/homoserine lactone efflux protein
MDITFLLRGLVVGFGIAAPVGPIGILVIRRTLAEGRLTGFVSGLGAATADMVYGFIAAFGLTFISRFLIDQSTWIRIAGGTFLLYLGLTTILAKPAQEAASATGRGLLSAYGSTIFLTLTNPTTILSFAAVFAGLGLASTRGNYADATLLVGGVFLGSSCWWLLLSGGVGLLRRRVTARGLQWVNRLSGAIITLFGIGALLSAAGSVKKSIA